MTRVLGVGLAAVALLSACGDEEASKPTGTQPAAAPSSSPEQQAVKDVVYRWIGGYEHAQMRVTCGLMTPRLRSAFVRAMSAAQPALRGKTCGQIFKSSAFRDPADQPVAVSQAATPDFEQVAVRGDRATITFAADGRSWRFAKMSGDWRIAAFPILPPSLAREASSDRALS